MIYMIHQIIHYLFSIIIQIIRIISNDDDSNMNLNDLPIP